MLKPYSHDEKVYIAKQIQLNIYTYEEKMKKKYIYDK